MSRDAAANPAILEAVQIQFDQVPGVSPLFLDFLSHESTEGSLFWPHRDDSLTDHSKVVIENHTAERDILCDALVLENESYGAGSETLANIELLRDRDCVAVLTGQQAGYLSGPAYTVYKALTAIRIASELKNAGVKAVPVFWIATEDHDFEEISLVRFRAESGTLVTARIVNDKTGNGRAVGNIRIGEESVAEISRIFSNIPVTRFSSDVRGLANRCFEPGRPLGRAFGSLLTSILGKYGLVFTNPLNPAIRALSSDIFVAAVEKIPEIGARLFERDEVLAKSGFHSQVKVNNGFVPFFAFDGNGVRKALEISGESGRIVSKDGELEFGVPQLLELAKNEPERLSPNALLRPVVQDEVFPTVCYVGGAAEICYFAQNAVIYEVLGRPVTPVRHRSAFTVFESRHRRTMRTYGIGFSDLFEGREAVTAKLAREIAGPATMRLFKETRESFELQLNKIESVLSREAPDVAKNLRTRRNKILWHIRALSEKFAKSEARNNEDLMRRLDDLFNNVMPMDSLQERTITYLDFLNLHGPNFTDWIYMHVDGSGVCHKSLSF